MLTTTNITTTPSCIEHENQEQRATSETENSSVSSLAVSITSSRSNSDSDVELIDSEEQAIEIEVDSDDDIVAPVIFPIVSLPPSHDKKLHHMERNPSENQKRRKKSEATMHGTSLESVLRSR